MSIESIRAEIAKLSLDEKYVLAHGLWEELERESADLPLTDAQREEVERRLREHEANPGQYQTWEEVRRELEDELK